MPFIMFFILGLIFSIYFTVKHWKKWPKKKTKKDTTDRNRFYRFIAITVMSLVISLLTLTKPDTASNLLMILGFGALATPWILITWVALVAVLPVMTITLPAELSEKIGKLRPDWKHVKIFLAGSAAVVTWILFAAIAAVYLKVYYNFFALSFTLLVAFFLALAPFGWKIKTTQKWPKRLRLMVIWLVLIPIIIGFIQPTIWVHLIGKDIAWHLSFKMPRAEYEVRQARKWLDKEKDSREAKSIKQVLSSTKITPDTTNLDSLQNKIDSTYKTFEEESIAKKTLGIGEKTVSKAVNEIKKIIPKKKTADPVRVEVVDETPLPEIHNKISQPITKDGYSFDPELLSNCELKNHNMNTFQFELKPGKSCLGLWLEAGTWITIKKYFTETCHINSFGKLSEVKEEITEIKVEEPGLTFVTISPGQELYGLRISIFPG